MKTVLLEITVPGGHYCWEYEGKHEICSHFSNEGGFPTCSLGFFGQVAASNDEGVCKPPKCDDLKEKE